MSDTAYTYLNIETTGLDALSDEILDIAIIDDAGGVLLNTHVKPVHKKSWDKALGIHGIWPAMVQDAPTLAELSPYIQELIQGQHLVLYNWQFVEKLMPRELEYAHEIRCCMLAFANRYREIVAGKRGFRWQKLTFAAAYVGHKWDEKTKYFALGDALACRTVWRWLQFGEPGPLGLNTKRTDTHAFAREQSRLLQTQQMEQIDCTRIAGEMGHLSAGVERELADCLAEVMTALLKAQVQGSVPFAKGIAALARPRQKVRRLLAQCPSLRAEVQAIARREFSFARFLAAAELDVQDDKLPSAMGFQLEELLDLGYWPSTEAQPLMIQQ